MKNLTLVLLVGIALAYPRVVHADDDPLRSFGADESAIVLVDRAGTFYASVHPSIVTVLYFPRAVTNALSSDDRYFRATIVDDSVVVRPAPDVPADAEGNLVIIAGDLKVSVILSVADQASEATPQRLIRSRSEEDAFEARVAAEAERRHRGAAREYERRLQKVERDVMREAARMTAQRLLQRHEVVKLKAIERNDDSIIVRIKRGVWVGRELYLFFSVQNRSGKPYHLARVQVFERAGTGARPSSDRAGQVAFHSDAQPIKGLLGTVRDGQYGYGVVHVRDADRMVGKNVTVRVSERDGRRAVSVGRVTWR